MIELSRAARESAGRTLRSAEEAIAPNKPKIVAVTTLEGANRVRMKSPGVKRGREDEDEEEIDVELESEEEGEDGRSCISSRDSSASRRETPVDQRGPQRKKRKGRGRPAKNPEHEGIFTAAKIRERAKEKELEVIEEKETDILDPSVKATSARAEEVDRNARRILEGFRELPAPELTERALRAIEAIKKVASTSKNIKGSFVGALWRSSEELTALSLAYTSRLRERESEERKGGKRGELEVLRSELSAIRTEHALMRRENQRLRGQVEELRARVVLGEAPRPSQPPQDSPKRDIGGRRKKGKATIPDSSTDEEMVVEMERDLSPETRRVGIQARREVQEDLEKGTLPPAIRPPIQGRRKELEEERRGNGNLSPPTTSNRQQRSSPPRPSMGLSQEEVVGLIQSAISRLLPQLGGGVVGLAEEKGKAQSQPGQGRKNPVTSKPAVVDKTVAVEEGQGSGKKKKRKRKGKKGKGGSGSQQGGEAPKGTGSLMPT